MKFLKWFGYISLLLLFVWFVFLRGISFNSEKKEDTASVTENMEEVENNDFVDDEASFIDESNEEAYQEEAMDEELTEEDVQEQEVIEEVSPISTGGIDLSKKYLIVVGSFGNRSNADRMLKRVKDSGKDGVIEKIRGLNRVITASSDDQNDAQNLRDHFTHIYKETAFILER